MRVFLDTRKISESYSLPGYAKFIQSERLAIQEACLRMTNDESNRYQSDKVSSDISHHTVSAEQIE